jgi:hypothetical protein
MTLFSTSGTLHAGIESFNDSLSLRHWYISLSNGSLEFFPYSSPLIIQQARSSWSKRRGRKGRKPRDENDDTDPPPSEEGTGTVAAKPPSKAALKGKGEGDSRRQ